MNVEPVDILAFSPHPDDVDLGCGGTLAALARRGQSFGIVDLTRGEMGTRGTPESRESEARQAARILGARFRETLDLGDGQLRTDRAAELRVVEAVRIARPHLVLAPLPADRHPDHVRASRLVADASWYAGLSKLETGLPPYRPDQVIFYAAYVFAPPTFLVDVSASFATKIAALRAYRSQFFDENSSEPETYVSSKGFFDGIEARARALGRIANVEYAEGFVSNVPPTLADPVTAFLGYEGGKKA
ncbi:MAG: bacillithiol biosynthesis deacetylase BshB1 [Thermoanaerobaculia bacterium]